LDAAVAFRDRRSGAGTVEQAPCRRPRSFKGALISCPPSKRRHLPPSLLVLDFHLAIGPSVVSFVPSSDARVTTCQHRLVIDSCQAPLLPCFLSLLPSLALFPRCSCRHGLVCSASEVIALVPLASILAACPPDRNMPGGRPMYGIIYLSLSTTTWTGLRSVRLSFAGTLHLCTPV
jgi:hypothetical protein